MFADTQRTTEPRSGKCPIEAHSLESVGTLLHVPLPSLAGGDTGRSGSDGLPGSRSGRAGDRGEGGGGNCFDRTSSRRNCSRLSNTGFGGSGSGSGRRRRRAISRTSASGIPDLGTRNSVASVAIVKVEVNTRIGISVANVEVEVLVWNSAARSGDLDLDARRVELGAAGGVDIECRVALVVGNDLLSDEVLPSSEGGGKGEVVLAAVGNKLLNGPFGAVVAVFINLGPDSTGAIALGVLRHPSNDGTQMGKIDNVITSRVVVPFESEGVAGSSGKEVGNSLAAIHVADEIGASEVFDGAVVGRGSDVGVAAVSLVHAVDPDAVHQGVGGNTAGQSQDGSDRVTHIGRVYVGVLAWKCNSS